ncbi:MAG: transketolase [Erysipelotrichaceae bacterium]|nr:transketolase [Erysipelotrichaceae bacterium]
MELCKKEWNESCYLARKHIIEMVFNSHSGHPGGALSCIDILVYVYKKFIISNNDIFILSKGHAAPALYSILIDEKIIKYELLSEFRTNGGRLKGHPSRLYTDGIEIGLGSLGIGLSIGVGEALALKRDCLNNKVFILTGDGELDEGSNWEAIMSACHFQLRNIVLIIDVNKLQLDGPTKLILKNDNLYNKFESFGWQVKEIDGHDFNEIKNAFLLLKNQTKPICIIANTIKGKGISFMEDNVDWHSVRISNKYDEYKEKALNELKNRWIDYER